jgi:hypothetical protein
MESTSFPRVQTLKDVLADNGGVLGSVRRADDLLGHFRLLMSDNQLAYRRGTRFRTGLGCVQEQIVRPLVYRIGCLLLRDSTRAVDP